MTKLKMQTQNTRLEKETAQLTQKSSDATRRMTEMQHLLEQERVQAGEAERAYRQEVAAFTVKLQAVEANADVQVQGPFSRYVTGCPLPLLPPLPLSLPLPPPSPLPSGGYRAHRN